MNDTIRHLEELSINAWPALETTFYDGWVLRFSAGYTRRGNSINPLYPSVLAPAGKLRECQRLYRERGLPAVFKMTPAAGDLDAVLGEHGFQREAATSVQLLALDSLIPPSPADVELLEKPAEAWVAAFCALNPGLRRHFLSMSQMLERIAPPACFLSLKHEGQTAGLGMAVAERGYVGIFDLVTRQTLRNKGIARQVVLHLLNWGRKQGAEHGYLQVVLENQPALHLFESLGFREAYQYWYRVRQGRP